MIRPEPLRLGAFFWKGNPMVLNFRLTPAQAEDVPQLRRELAQAMDKRLEVHSRQTMPGLWSLTDRLDRTPRAPEKVLKRRRVRYRIYGALLLFLGLFLLIPGLMEPKELAWPLAAGVLATFSGVRLLLPRRRGPTHRGWRQAETLLKSLTEPTAKEVEFSDAAIGIRSDDGSFQVLYEAVNALIETERLYVFSVLERSALVLQKKDLVKGDAAAFLPFLSEKTGLIPIKTDAVME